MNPVADDDVKNVGNALRKYEKVLKANASKPRSTVSLAC